ncbi:N-acyl-D-amino-acid deacylase family protein [Minwuia sp.]|uniref:N-acyl-D-amino-acid deacylase family protein n=1 Tax=Minwuia sp. TaxID=2493630 RepID=UPI003A8F9835
MADYDLIVRNAVIYDGLGNDPVSGDMAVSDGRVTAIGTVSGSADREIDAAGAAVAPGIVDVHTHYDAQLTWDPTASPSPALGVTTVVIGNCGFGIAPAPAEARDTILANLSVVEAMSLDSLHAGVDFSFTGFGEYLDLVQSKKPFPNVAAMASHSVMRTAVMGDAGSEREATMEELDRMQALFREALDAGAIGMGSSTFENHFGAGGRPVPSRMASDDEFRAFARTLGDAGGGLMMATCGDRTSVRLLGELAELANGASIYAPLLHYSNQPDRAMTFARECAAEREAGRPVYPQCSCQPLSMDFTLEAAYPMLTIDGWPEDGDVAKLKTAFADPAVRQQIREALKVPSGTRIFNGHWERVEITIAGDESLTGLTIADLAQKQGKDPLDAILDLALSEDLKTVFTAKLLNVEEDAVAELLSMPGNIVSLSDAGAHHTLFCDAGFGIYFLSHWVREAKKFTLTEAIRKLTSEPARIYGLEGRGELTVGSAADFIIFDPETLELSRTKKLKDLPADGERLVREAPGLKGTFVNGVQVHDGSDYLDVDGPGRVLRRGRSHLDVAAE